MGTRKFEAHITCDRKDSVKIQTVGGIHGWSFSAIDGDPIMGKKPYAYLTAYNPDGLALLEDMRSVVIDLKMQGVDVLREKVEEIVFDSKTGHNVLKEAA